MVNSSSPETILNFPDSTSVSKAFIFPELGTIHLIWKRKDGTEKRYSYTPKDASTYQSIVDVLNQCAKEGRTSGLFNSKEFREKLGDAILIG